MTCSVHDQHCAAVCASGTLPCPVAVWAVAEMAVVLQVDAAAAQLRDSVLSTAEAEGLTYQSYWLSSTLALGAFLKVHTCSSLHCLHARRLQCWQVNSTCQARVYYCCWSCLRLSPTGWCSVDRVLCANGSAWCLAEQAMLWSGRCAA